MRKWALLSVTDKTGIVELGQGLAKAGFGLLSTGGTAKVLREKGLSVTDVAEYTGFPEIMDGRVKTLHPKLYAGVLCDRSDPEHMKDLKAAQADVIDVVVVNLYDFAGEARSKGLEPDDAIEYIDIGGPTMLRAAAKNYASCTSLMDPKDYPRVLSDLEKSRSVSKDTRQYLAAKVFANISQYDQMIAAYFASYTNDAPKTSGTEAIEVVHELRYGENPHQKAQLCSVGSDRSGLLAAEIHQGKELSYNNYLDLDAALQLCSELSDATTAVIVKHTNPCGAASLPNAALSDVYQKALACDPVSAFGGIIALNQVVDEATARLLSELFVECIAAPGYSDSARSVFAAKKNLRILSVDVKAYAQNQGLQMRSLAHGLLRQSADSPITASSSWQLCTQAKADEKVLHNLKFAMTVAKHVKSNAIVLAKAGATIGVGAGQMSRIDALECAVKKARGFKLDLADSCLASDAFFPFRDCVDESAKAGVRYIVQPGGSVRDQESIDACNEHKIAMYLSKERHFRH